MSANRKACEQLSAYLDGELSGADAERVARAVAADADLQRELAELSATRDLIRALPAQKPPEDLAGRVLAEAERIQLVGAAHAAQAGGALRWVRYMATAAVLLVAASVGMIVGVTLWSPPRSELEMAAVGPNQPEAGGDGRHLAFTEKVAAEARKHNATLVIRGPGRADGNGRGEPIAAKPAAAKLDRGERYAFGRHKKRLYAVKGGVESGAQTVTNGSLATTAAAGNQSKDSLGSALAVAEASNEVIFTDRMAATRQAVEELLASNGIGPAVVSEPKTFAKQPRRPRARSNVYFANLDTTGQVQLEAWVTPEQIPALQEQLNRLRERQAVSQEGVLALASLQKTPDSMRKGRHTLEEPGAAPVTGAPAPAVAKKVRPVTPSPAPPVERAPEEGGQIDGPGTDDAATGRFRGTAMHKKEQMGPFATPGSAPAPPLVPNDPSRGRAGPAATPRFSRARPDAAEPAKRPEAGAQPAAPKPTTPGPTPPAVAPAPSATPTPPAKPTPAPRPAVRGGQAKPAPEALVERRSDAAGGRAPAADTQQAPKAGGDAASVAAAPAGPAPTPKRRANGDDAKVETEPAGALADKAAGQALEAPALSEDANTQPVVEVTIVNGLGEADRLRRLSEQKLHITGQFGVADGARKSARQAELRMPSLGRGSDADQPESGTAGGEAGRARQRWVSAQEAEDLRRDRVEKLKAYLGVQTRPAALAEAQDGNATAAQQAQQQVQARLRRLLITLNYRAVADAGQSAAEATRAELKAAEAAGKAAQKKAPQ